MKLEHKFVVPAPVDEAWVAFNDLGRVVPCFPGATLTSADGDEFTGSCKVKLGPVSLQYSGNGTFVERDESDHHAVIEAKGKDRRGNGTASVRVVARLTAADATSTQVTVDTDLTITGRPAQFGRGLIQEVSDRLLAQFTTCLTTTLQTPTTPPASAPPTTPSSAPSAEPTAQAQPTGPAQSTGPAQPASPAQPVDPARAGAPSATAPGGGPVSAAGTPQAPDAKGAPPGASSSDTMGAPPGAASSDAQGAPPGATSASAAGGGAEAVELNLVTTMLPVIARRVRPYLIGAVLALVLRRLLRR